MEIDGFDTYVFSDNSHITYAIKEFQTKTSIGRIKTVLELIIYHDHVEKVKISQKNPRNPQFFVKNACEGLLRPIGSTIAKQVRGLLVSFPTGDMFEGNKEAIKEVGKAFLSLPLPKGDVVIRLPIIFAEKIEFSDKQGKTYQKNRVNFELRPEGYGYIFCTAHSIKVFPEKLLKIFKSF